MLRSLLVFALTLIPSVALAHVDLDDPPMRSGGDQKRNPCAGSSASSTRVEFVGGSTITMSWTETIQHPGYFLISLDPDGATFDGDGDGTGDYPESPNLAGSGNGDGSLVLQRVEDTNSQFGGKISAEVTLPDIDCDQCTLQLIQMMSDKTPSDARPTEHIYFRCADIKIVSSGGGAPAPSEPDPIDFGGAPGVGGAEGDRVPVPAGGAGGSGGTSGAVAPVPTPAPAPTPPAPSNSSPNPAPSASDPVAPTAAPTAAPTPTATATATDIVAPAPTPSPTGPAAGGAPATPPDAETSSGDDGGCSLVATPRSTTPLHAAWLLVFGLMLAVRRRVHAVE